MNVSIKATSNRGKSKIGKSPVDAVIEQVVGDKLFVVFPTLNQCRWITRNDKDFAIIE